VIDPELLYGSPPANRDPGVTADERLRLPITVTDVTLREGQQAAEVAFSPAEEVEVAAALADAGVAAVQVGYAGADDASVRRVRAACPDLRIAVLVVGWKEDAEASIRSARDAGADICSILFRAADAHLADLGVTPDEARRRIEALVAEARACEYPCVMFGPSFATLAPHAQLLSFYRSAIEAGAQVISVADSLGMAKPEAVRALVSSMRALDESVGIRVHMHNDCGLALACTLAGVEAGADWVDATVNGLGERAGNCALEELVLALGGLYGVDLGIAADKLYELSSLVERLTGIAIPPMKPVVGSNCFANKLEIHVKAAARDPRLMEPYDPSVVGRRRTIVLGRGTGETGVRVKLAELGLDLPDALLDEAVRQVNERAVATKRSIPDTDFVDLIGQLKGMP
jgi:isopropylmalate/homocitrate/citramalate synthase